MRKASIARLKQCRAKRHAKDQQRIKSRPRAEPKWRAQQNPARGKRDRRRAQPSERSGNSGGPSGQIVERGDIIALL